MRCKWSDQTLADYVLGQLDRQAEQALKQHLGGCPACQNQVQTLIQSSRQIQAIRPKAPEALKARVLRAARLSAEQPKKKTMGWWIPVAATVAISALLVVPRWGRFSTPASSAEVIASYQEDLQTVDYSTLSSELTGEETLDEEWLGVPQEINQYLN